DLNDVVRSVERLVRSDGVRHGVTVELDLDPDLPPVSGDEIQLQQVVMNLMLNAFAAMDPPPAAAEGPARRLLVVRTRAASAASASASADASQVRAEFEDTGAGIAADVVDRLFEPFVTTKPD